MNIYHILFETSWASHNIFHLNDTEIEKVVSAYDHGKHKFFIKGEMYSFESLIKINIFKVDFKDSEEAIPSKKLADEGHIGKNELTEDAYVKYSGMLLLGKDVTTDFIRGDHGELLENSEAYNDSIAYKNSQTQSDLPSYDYAILTSSDIEYLSPLNSFINYEDRDTRLASGRSGTWKGNNKLKIATLALGNCGMVDAAIATTNLLIHFQPKFLIIVGGCKSRAVEELSISDIIVASKVYTFQKAKLNDKGIEGNWEVIETDKNLILKIEDSTDEFNVKLKSEGQLHIEPMAVSTAVIDKIGVIEDLAISKDKTTLGLEMEAYGVLRACQISNGGSTKALIVKALMDNEQDATAKNKVAAFVKNLIESNLLR